ncbi:MAG: ATP synthase F0 subunit C [Clostridiales bacterium]|nr:ATP synthase F0 subunit C [Clostridiales bacterium]
MDGIIAISAALAIAVSTTVPAYSQGRVVVTALEMMARQPAEAGSLRTTMILGLAFVESLTIYGLLIAFMLLGKMG